MIDLFARRGQWNQYPPPANLIDFSGDCWEWLGYKDSLGYGRFMAEKRDHLAHRVVYEALVGPIPEGLVIDHLCRNPSCVNPDHLEPVTQSVNVRRGVNVPPVSPYTDATHCVNGHEFTPENTRYRARQGGGRQCRACDRERRRKVRASA